jgi:hypothetical protein
MQVSKLVAALRPKIIMTTYEGHAWERIVFAAARESNPTIRCFGYQHAAIFHLQHAIRRNIGSAYNPDIVFTAGKVGFGQLKKSSNLEGVGLAVLGSDRAVGISPYPGQPANQKGQAACLVIPEGLISECLLLFRFSIECARLHPGILFIWRLHPVVSFSALFPTLGSEEALPANVRLSSSTIDEDINLSTWALYRGSTAIVQSINAGIIPVYFDTGGMVIDPLYEVNDREFSAKSPDDFTRVIHETAKIGTVSPALSRIREYANNFFEKMQPATLAGVIKNL